MARVTVEDCVDKVPNRFELVLLAAHRARTISAGAQISIDRDNDKNPVVALREIADKNIAPDDLKEDFIHSHAETCRGGRAGGRGRADALDRHQDARARPGRSVADTAIDKMTEEELLRRMASQAPSDGSNAGPRSR